MKQNLFAFGFANRLSMLALIAVLGLLASCQKAIDSNDLRSETEMLRRSPAPGTSTITQIAVSNPNFSELVNALLYVDDKLGANLVATFNGKDQFTVFAPTNAAFQQLYTTLGVKSITEVDAKTVLAVLQYHVATGRRAANSVVPPQGFKTIETLLSGATFSVNTSGMIQAVGNTANITAADISASNGIIHVLDAVILPIKL